MRNEYMGWFGLSWQEKVAESMYRILGKDFKSTMKDFMQPGGYNVNLVNTLYGFYLTGKQKETTVDDLAGKTELDPLIAQSFLVALKDNAAKGNIEYKIYDPETAMDVAETKTKLLTSPNVKAFSTYAKIGLGIVGGIVLLSVLSYLPKGAR